MANILIKNGLVVSGGQSRKADVIIAEGKIVFIGNYRPSACNYPLDRTVDAKGCLVTYGLADVHVHFRQPGFEYKETISTGSKAAAHGGFTTVCSMPNLNPAPDSKETLQVELDAIRQNAVIEVKPYATITKGRKGLEVVDIPSLKDKVCGFSDDGSGVQKKDVMTEAMLKINEADSILAAHCEDNSLLHGGYIHDGYYAKEHDHKGICSESEWRQIARDVSLAEETGCHYHVCHISTRESVEIIRRAQKKGVNVTCETGPHYLTLTEDDLQEDGRFKMNPPLRSKTDRQALIQGIQDGTIRIIATDHAPHTDEEKAKGLEKSAMGISGLETSFPVVYTKLVKTGIISLEEQIKLMCDNPRRIFRLGGKMAEGEDADLSVFDLENPYVIHSKDFFSKGKSTPFEGWQVYGRCILTLFKGNIVYKAI